MKKMLQLLTVLSLLQLSAGNPRLVCQETVVAQIGGNVTLPCQLEPKQNIEHETIQCKRRGDSSQLVYACRNGKQLPDQLAQYKHRTSLDFEDLKIGVLNLNINSVTQSDNGTYQLYIHKWKINSIVTLVVGNPHLVCQETVVAKIGDNVTLPCQLEPKQNIEHETIDCKRGDSSQLVYAHRNGKQSPDQLAQYKHRTSLDFEDLKIGVLNLNINSVTQSDNGTYQLYIRKWKIYSTVTLVVGVPPPGVPPPDKVIAVDVPVVPIVLGAIVLGAIVLGVVLFLVKPKWIQRCWTRMMKRRALKSQHDDEEPHRAAGNGHLDLKQLAERETMLK